MTAKDLVKQAEGFPVLSGDIVKDTETIIGELAVGNYVIERGMARLYLVWLTREFLNVTESQCLCPTCGLTFEDDGKTLTCPRCESIVTKKELPLYPTLEAYISHVSDMTGKSRQTLFSRLRVYRVLCEERGVDPSTVFELNLLSSGAASRLASADEDDEHLSLVNDSWNETAAMALEMGTKSGALEYIKYDVLHRPKISAEITMATKSIKIYREYHMPEEDQYVLEEYGMHLDGEWPEQVMDWLTKRLGAKVN